MIATNQEIHQTVGRMDKLHIPKASVRQHYAPKPSTKRCMICNEFLTVIEHAKYLFVCARCGENGQKHVHIDTRQRLTVVETNGAPY